MTCCCGSVAGGIIAFKPKQQLTAEDITRLVEEAGGNINALFRASLAWDSWSDIDLHINEPNGQHIFFSHKKSDVTGGELDVDMNINSQPHSSNSNKHSKPAVENIMYTDLARMGDGDYIVSYVQYGVDNTRRSSADRPYLLLEHRTPEEPRMSHYVLLKQNGRDLSADTSHNEPIATVRKTGNNFAIVALAENTVILKNHNFNTGNYPTQGGDSGNSTANSATSGENPTGE